MEGSFVFEEIDSNGTSAVHACNCTIRFIVLQISIVGHRSITKFIRSKKINTFNCSFVKCINFDRLALRFIVSCTKS